MRSQFQSGVRHDKFYIGSLIGEDTAARFPFEKAMSEIHTLAYFYHWGYAELMRLSANKRERFMEYIKRQVEMEGGGEA